MRLSVEGRRVEDGNSVPARLDLNREVILESTGRLRVMEDVLEGGVLEGGSVDVSGNPVGEEEKGSVRNERRWL
jgi:hypothetical protein